MQIHRANALFFGALYTFSLTLLSSLIACSHSSSDSSPTPATSSTTLSASASVSAPPASSTSAATPSTSPSTSPASLAGQYDSKASTVDVPTVKWKGDDDGKTGIGTGDIALSIEADGTAKGTIAGVLGDERLFGTAKDDTLRGTMVPKDPTAESFYGTFVAQKKDGVYSGKLMASRANAGALREVDFTLKAK